MSNSEEYERNIIKQCFKNRQVFLYVLEMIDKEEIFQEQICATIWKIYVSINKEGFNLHITNISDVIKFSGYEGLQEHFHNIINTDFQDEEEWKYHLYVMQENYKKNVLMDISKCISSEIHESSSEEIMNNISSSIMELQTAGIKTTSMTNACTRAIEDIRDINDGKKQSFLKTGNNKFDELVAISEAKFILVPALAKIGKTRWIIDLVDRLINNNEHVNVQWYTFEMKPDEVLKCFIGRKLKMDNYTISGKKGKISDEKMKEISNVTNYFSSYNIEFIGEQVTINTIYSKFTKFCKEHVGGNNILIIDNLAYIKMHIKDQIQFEDDVARILVSLRDHTNGIIFLLHHLTKETDSKWNKDTGYEPKLGYIRGSKRLIDCPNQILMLHRPDFFSDLVKDAELAGRGNQIKGLFVALLEVNRDGKTGIITYNHEIEFSYFSER